MLLYVYVLIAPLLITLGERNLNAVILTALLAARKTENCDFKEDKRKHL